MGSKKVIIELRIRYANIMIINTNTAKKLYLIIIINNIRCTLFK